ncbi:MAG: hypothetical protein ACI9E1_001064 [Cryomorphaceae bacterium]|jgi:hypothetical protein
MTWNDQFLDLFRSCLNKFNSGKHSKTDFDSYYTKEDLSFLNSIGYKPRELFDFVEDLGAEGAPSESTALLVAAVRRDYLQVVQDGQHSDKEITRDDIPTFGDTLTDITYLPRIIAKARAKLKGELDPDVMFGCGGDRKFLKDHGNIPMADFLRNVWSAGTDDLKIANYVKNYSA